METELKKRLKTFIKYLGLSQNAFLVSVGLSKGYMQKVNKYISPKTLTRMLSLYPRLNVEWLHTGKGNMITLVSNQESKKYIDKITGLTDNADNSKTNESPQTGDKNNYAPRIKLIRDTLFGGSNRKFAEKVGAMPNIISMWCTVKAGNRIVNKIVENLPQINKDWLLTGIGSMTLNEEQIQEQAITNEPQTVKPHKTSLEQSFDSLVKLTEHNMDALEKIVALFEKEKKEKENLIKENKKLLQEKNELFELLHKYSAHTQQYKTLPVREQNQNQNQNQNKNYTIKVKENNNGKKI